MADTATTQPTHPLLDAHRETLEEAAQALRERSYYSRYPESPSPRVYGENAPQEGQAAHEKSLNTDFPGLNDQPTTGEVVGDEKSPYGPTLGIRYPQLDIDAAMDAALAAMPAWRDAGAEVRAGVYVFFDLFQAGIGSCGRDDIALAVLTTVIGNHPERGQLVVDAGALALSKDISTGALGEAGDCGYGLVADADTGVLLDDLYVHGVSQEHGIVRSRHGSIEHAGFPIGRRLLVLPNHACLTAAAYDRYHVVGEGTAIEAVWPRVNGW